MFYRDDWLTKISIFIFALFAPTVLSAQVVINEIGATNLCSVHNPNQVEDNFGECEDWVELYNNSPDPFDLSGYHMTDRITNLDKWTFPGGSIIPGNGFLRIWLSGRMGLPFDLNNLHANFRLGQTQENEIIALVAPDGSTIIDVNMMEETSQLGHTRGRYPDGADNWVVFTQPTINASNNTSTPFTNYAPTPEFDQPAGYHGGGITVSISIPDPSPEFVIRYTLDGTFPTEASPLYTGPININETTVLMAATFSNNPEFLRSFFEWSTFFVGEDQHTLPAFSVAGDEVLILLGGVQNIPITTMEVFDENGQRISKSFGDTNKHGNDSWAYAQRGIDWIDRDKMGYSGKTELELFRISDRPRYKRYMFKAGANDNYPYENGAHIRDAYVQSLSQVGGMDLDCRSTEFCVLYANGQYWGVYDYREKVDDWRYTDYYYSQDKFSMDFIKTWGNTWAKWGTMDNWNTLRNFITSQDMTDQVNYDYVKTQLNVISLIDYFAINTWIVAADWLNWNTAWWRGYNEFGGATEWRYTLWDMDAAFGHYINYTGIPNTGPTADPCFGHQLNNPGGQGHTQIFSALLENEEFFETYINRYADLINSTLSCEFSLAHLDSLINIIDPEMPRQIERWGGTYAGWQNNVQALIDFIEARCEEQIVEGLEDCYDLTAIEVTIEIVGDGEVVLNSITIGPGDTPWTGTYFAEVPFDLTANPTGEAAFQFWETLLGELEYDDETQFEITVNPQGDVTIVANFIPLEEYPITFNVEPPGTGWIELNEFLIPNYPYTDSLTALIEHDIVASAEPGWAFSHWETVHQGDTVFAPNDTSAVATYTTAQTDEVIAHFYQLPVDLIVTVEEPGMGYVVFNGQTLEDNPATVEIVPGNTAQFEAVPEEGYEFVGWTFQNHFVTNLDDLFISFEVVQSDSIVALFQVITIFNVVVMTDPAEYGTVEIHGTDEGSWWEGMLSTQETHPLRAVPANEFYDFIGWQSTDGGTFAPNADMRNVQLQIVGEDTIIASFIELPNYPITVRVEPEGSGSVMLDWNVLPFLPWTGNVLAMNNTHFKALPQQKWEFSHWSTTYHTPVPSDESAEIRLDIQVPDEIVAHFVPREFRVFIPNAFTPDGDGINEIFRPLGNEWDPSHFRMQIFNRAGKLVFETTDVNQGWNGAEASGEYFTQPEVYVYSIEVKNAITQEVENYRGHVTVLR